MNWLLILIIVLLVLINLILPFFIKSWGKKFLYTTLLSLIVLGVLGFFVWQDLTDIKENFSTGRKMFLMKSNNDYIAGIVIRELDNPDTMTYISEELLANYKDLSFSEIKDNNFKIFIMKEQFFEPTNSLKINKLMISKEQLLIFLRDENPIDSFIEYFIKQNKESSIKKAIEDSSLEDNEETRQQFEHSYNENKNELAASIKADLGISTNSQMKGMLFSVLMFETLNSQDQTYLLEQYQKNNLIIYPETLIFSIVKLVPLSTVKDKIEALKIRKV